MNKARNKPRKWRYKALNEDYNKFQVKKSSSRHPTTITSQGSLEMNSGRDSRLGRARRASLV